MNNPSVSDRGARRTGAIAVVLAATLAALVAVLVLAKPSGAQNAPQVTLTVDPAEVGFGAVVVDNSIEGSIATRTITITNTGTDPITIPLAAVEFRSATGELLSDSDFSTSIGPEGLTIAGNGGTNTFEVSFDPDTAGTSEAVLTFTEGLVDGTVVDGIELVNEAGDTVTGIDVTGTGTQTDPFEQPGTQGCTIVGTNNEREVLTGTPGRDVICGRGGTDLVSALRGNDRVRGGNGNDVVRSSKGRDTLLGGAGGDRLTDKAGRRGDRLFGQGGRDTLITKDGKRGDLLVGGPRRDRAFKDRGDRARSI